MQLIFYDIDKNHTVYVDSENFPTIPVVGDIIVEDEHNSIAKHYKVLYRQFNTNSIRIWLRREK
jgi:hypothetical protein